MQCRWMGKEEVSFCWTRTWEFRLRRKMVHSLVLWYREAIFHQQ